MSRPKPPAGGGNQLRIIAGRWRSRRIRFLDAQGLRPTPDRVRETLFNWLQFEVAGARCLDAFAGSGALAFEALSRGAASALLVERDQAQARCLREQADLLEAAGCTIVTGEVERVLGEAGRVPAAGFDLIFLDPPFHQGLIAPVCKILQQNRCLHPRTRVYIETELDWPGLALPPEWVQLRATRAGLVNSFLCRYEPIDSAATL